MYFGSFSKQNEEDLRVTLGTTLNGLSKVDARKRFLMYGPNELKEKKVNVIAIFLRQFSSVFVLILFVAGFLSLLAGGYADAVIIFFFVAINAGLGFLQEYHSEKAVELLEKFVATNVRVFRDGIEMVIPSCDLVKGDKVKLITGDIVSADIRLISSEDITVDESTLSGESVPVHKKGNTLKGEATTIPEAENIVFSGTKVVGGEGMGYVIGTGIQTALGDIAHLSEQEQQPSIFEHDISILSRKIFKLVGMLLALFFVLHLFVFHSALSFTTLVFFAIALCITIIPEALPVITTLSLSKGAMRLARNKVVVKRLSSVEDIGAVEILCIDKTGTITENKMKIGDTFGDNIKETLKLALIPGSLIGQKSHDSNPFDAALWNEIDKKDREDIGGEERIHEISFDSVRRIDSVLVKHLKGYEGNNVLVARGAPEAMLHRSLNVTPSTKLKALHWFTEEGKKGRRVLAVGFRTFEHDVYTSSDEKDFHFVGMVSFVDPIKSTAKKTISDAAKLGLEIKIISGDSREVVYSVATEVGLISHEYELMLGEELEGISDAKAIQRIEYVKAFARVSPSQKFRIIQLLEKKKRVAFLGDGINDAPALKEAHVGMAVQHASDIARDAADIVLLNKSLESVIEAIKTGREVIVNIGKYLRITLSSSFGNFISISIASLLLNYSPLLAIQILLLNLATDFPMISIAGDNVDLDDLKKPISHDVKEIIRISIVFGIITTLFDNVFFLLFRTELPGVLQTNWFIGSVIAGLITIFSLRSMKPWHKAVGPSRLLVGLMLPPALIAFLLPYTKFGTSVFHFVPPSANHMGIIIFALLAFFVILELGKRAYQHFTVTRPQSKDLSTSFSFLDK